MKKLVIAEKPSVGRELASVLGCTNRGKYLEGPSYVVTWALGHLVTLCPPDTYGEKYRRWTLGNLPMLPPVLNTMVIEKTRDQYETVKELLDREDIGTVVIATDAGREGELVARWILKQAGCKKPTQRLWISSQTESAIKQGFENLRDGSEYDNLYYAAESRSYADWYIGFNVSRAMSCHFDSRLSAGRVQTPTLALITEREDEIESFAGKFYWTVRADFGRFKASYFTEDGTVKIHDEGKAQELYSSLKGKTGRVTSVKKVSKTEKPPLAYDLTELQRDANTMLGFSAKQTLDTLQRLYEVHKIVTYPRTDSRYITDDIVPTFPQRLEALKDTPFASVCPKLSEIRTDLSRLVNNEMVSDHHALLPTEQPVRLDRLTSEERALWELVITRFLETLSADYEYSTTTVEIDVDGSLFSARMTMPDRQGWRDISRMTGRRSSAAAPDDESEYGLYGLKEGSPVTVNAVELKRFATLPPQRYTEADLLYAMEHAGRLVDDRELKKRLENGLGTPATRADIIEKLIQNNCMERKDGFLVPTAKGRELVRLVPPQLRSAELTGRWEQRLFAISHGEESEKPFIEDIKKNAADLVKEVISNNDSYDPSRMGDPKHLCPACKWPMVKVIDAEGKTHFVCQRFSCGYEEIVTKKQIRDKILLARSVIKESHYRTAQRKERDAAPVRKDTGTSTGGTFADFIRASEERKKGRKH
ncbi:MAG: DNA topoisomerase 3 [Sphaerochaetaceae bacterium]|nr:DNA topoisomerase 3 [Sphaerochaetaceae bacterium]